MLLKADFHNHTCLSPCASLELSPRVLVDRAAGAGIRVLALTDHNAAGNTSAFESLCRGAGLLPLCGLEVTTIEELHCLCLFESAERALAFEGLVQARLPRFPHNPETWGDQVIVDEDETILGQVDFYLGMSCRISLAELGTLCLSRGGLFIPAHIDRPSQSILSQFGHLPPGPYTALETHHNPCVLETRGLTLVAGSDAHFPGDVGQRTCVIEAEAATFSAVRRALAQGRVRW